MPDPQILNDQLTLNQLEGQIVPTTLSTSCPPPGFSDLPTALIATSAVFSSPLQRRIIIFTSLNGHSLLCAIYCKPRDFFTKLIYYKVYYCA